MYSNKVPQVKYMKHYEIYQVGIISFPIEVYKEKSIEPQK